MEPSQLFDKETILTAASKWKEKAWLGWNSFLFWYDCQVDARWQHQTPSWLSIIELVDPTVVGTVVGESGGCSDGRSDERNNVEWRLVCFALAGSEVQLPLEYVFYHLDSTRNQRMELSLPFEIAASKNANPLMVRWFFAHFFIVRAQTLAPANQKRRSRTRAGHAKNIAAQDDG